MGGFMKLLGTGNTKTIKGEKKGYRTYILHLAPGDMSGHQVCPKASAGCLAACLNTAGRAAFTPSIIPARIRKTQWFFADRQGFLATLHEDIKAAIRECERKELIPAIRLNGTSDLAWERYDYTDKNGVFHASIFAAFPSVTFYDYTKRLGRKRPANYHLTFSRSETNELDCRLALKEGMNVAAVFTKGNVPAEFLGRPVINGEESDLRFLDASGSIVGLVAKGKAKADCSGFVVR
jgi:hypothetical protein